MKMRSDFAVFILTHGRPDKVHTYDTLMNCGYDGKVYIVCDNQDKTVGDYKKNFPNKVVIFDKKAVAETFDTADNFEDMRAIVYARNACFQIAKDLDVKYFIQLDDDYTDFRYKMDGEGRFIHRKGIEDINVIFSLLVDFLEATPTKTIAMAQGGDFLGGIESSSAKKRSPKRKAMNSFVCSVDRPFQFLGRVNEDVNTYTLLGSRGDLFLTILLIALQQVQTQSNSGGMTELYLDGGTYLKSFYSVMFCPSSVKISLMASRHGRLHHRITWNNTVPKILDESYKK